MASTARKIDESLVILDVGHGNSAVLLDADSVVVIDAGRGSTLLDFLDEQGISHIDVVLLSHADYDHIGGLIALLSNSFSIGKVRANTDSIKGTNAWEDLRFELSNHPNIDFQTNLTVDNSHEFNTEQVSVEVAAPTSFLAGGGPGSTDREGNKLDTNSVSAVIRLVFDGIPFALLPGDLDAVGLANIEDSRTIEAPLLIFPHHGGRQGKGDVTEFVNALLAAVKAEHIVFSIGRGQHSTPRPDLVAAIRIKIPGCRISCSQLSEHCAASLKSGVTSTHLDSAFAKGRHRGTCCAGTIIYNFKAKELSPKFEQHQEFIALAAESALCTKTE
jgi:competence protein ComEC